MAADPNELAEVYSRFEKAHAAGDYKSAQELKTYAEQLEGMAQGGGALQQEAPVEAGPALSAEPEKKKPFTHPIAGAATAFKLGFARSVSNYLSSKESDHQTRETIRDHVASRLPDEWKTEIEKSGKPISKMKLKELGDKLGSRFGRDKVEAFAKENLNEETKKWLIDDAMNTTDGYDFRLYDDLIRPYFSKDGPDLAQNWKEKLGKLRSEYSPEDLASVDKPFVSEKAEGLKPSTWFDETTKAPWHDFNGAFLTLMENTPQLLALPIAGRFGGALGARAGVAALGKGPATLAATRQALTRGSRIGGAIAGGAAEGVLIRDAVNQQTYDQLMELDDETWKTNGEYHRLRDAGLNDTEAKQLVANDIALKSGNVAMVASGFMMGAPAGAVFGHMASGQASRSFVTNILKGFGTEVGQEIPQEATEQVISNFGVRRVDPQQNIFEGTGEAMAGAAFTAGPPGALGGAFASRKGPGLSKEQQGALDAIKPWEEAADARWKLQNKLTDDDWAKDRSPEEMLASLDKLETLQNKEAETFMKAEPQLRRSMIKHNAPDDHLLRLDQMKASAHTILAHVSKARGERTDAKKEVESARKLMKERQELVDAVEQDVLKRNDLEKIEANIERVRNQEALSADEYDQLETLEYGRFSEDGSRFIITRKGQRALPELKEQLKKTQARIEGSYTGDERRKDSGLRERIEKMTPEQMEDALYKDPTTGVLNRRAFDEAPHAPAYAEVDVDSLKWVNDNISVEAGDKLLKRVAEVLNEQEGVVYRLGGDEFGVLGRSEEELEAALQRAKIELDDTQPLTEGRQSITPSITWAVGKDRKSVTAKVTKMKAKREKAGKRAARGEKPPGYRDLHQTLLLHKDDEVPAGLMKLAREVDEHGKSLADYAGIADRIVGGQKKKGVQVRINELERDLGRSLTDRERDNFIAFHGERSAPSPLYHRDDSEQEPQVASRGTQKVSELPKDMQDELRKYGVPKDAELPLIEVQVDDLSNERALSAEDRNKIADRVGKPKSYKDFPEDLDVKRLPPIIVAKKNDAPGYWFVEGRHRRDQARKTGVGTLLAVDIGRYSQFSSHGELVARPVGKPGTPNRAVALIKKFRAEVSSYFNDPPEGMNEKAATTERVRESMVQLTGRPLSATEKKRIDEIFDAKKEKAALDKAKEVLMHFDDEQYGLLTEDELERLRRDAEMEDWANELRERIRLHESMAGGRKEAEVEQERRSFRLPDKTPPTEEENRILDDKFERGAGEWKGFRAELDALRASGEAKAQPKPHISGRTYRFDMLPQDMQDEINSYAKGGGKRQGAPRNTARLGGKEIAGDTYLPLVDMPIGYFPKRAAHPNRSIPKDVDLEDLPPVVIAKKNDGSGYWFIDGRHRYETARERGVASLRAIDIGEYVQSVGHGDLNMKAVATSRKKATYSNLNIIEREGGYPHTFDTNPGMFPVSRLVVPKDLYDQINPEDIEFVLDKNGQMAIPSYIAGDMYEHLMRENGIQDDSHVVHAVRNVLRGKLKKKTIEMMVKSNRGTISVKSFNAMLAGINVVRNSLNEETVKGNPAMDIYPLYELERDERHQPRSPVQGNIFPSTYSGMGLSPDTSWENYKRGSDYKPYFSTYVSHVIGDETADLLKTKRTVGIWCNADEYYKFNELAGFSTGMFISEVHEAKAMGVNEATQEQVDESNRVFSDLAAQYIGLDERAMYEAILADYSALAETNPVVKYNIKEMNDGLAIFNENELDPRDRPTGDRTLVIHPKDKSTDFLKAIYAGHPEWTVLTGDKNMDEVNAMIAEHDRIIMLGHGGSSGLMAVGQFTRSATAPTVSAAKPSHFPAYPKASRKKMRDAEAVKQKLLARFSHLPPITLEASATNLDPDTFKNIVANHGVSGPRSVRGFIHPTDPRKGIVMVVGNISEAGHGFEQNFAETLFHELVGHYGLRGLMGSDVALAEISASIRKGFPAEARHEAAKLITPEQTQKILRGDLTREQAIDNILHDPDKASIVGEEVFANITGKVVSSQINMTLPQRTVWQRAMDAVRAWLIKHGYGKYLRMDDKGIRNLIAASQNYIHSGKPWEFRIRTGNHQLPFMRDGEIFKAGILTAIESGTREPLTPDERRKAKETGIARIPLFADNASINAHIESVRTGLKIKAFSQKEVEESAILSVLKVNPVEWLLTKILKQTEEQFATNTGIPVADIKGMVSGKTQIDRKNADKIIAYVKGPNALEEHAMSISVHSRLAVMEAIEKKLTPEVFMSGTVMTYRQLNELIGKARSNGHPAGLVGVDPFEFMPEHRKTAFEAEENAFGLAYAKYEIELEKAVAQHRARPEKPVGPQAPVDDVVDPSKVKLSRDDLRRLVDLSSMPQVMPWVSGYDPRNRPAARRTLSAKLGIPEAALSAEMVEEEAKTAGRLGAEIGKFGDTWLDIPDREVRVTYPSWVPIGGKERIREVLFYDMRNPSKYYSGHFSGVSTDLIQKLIQNKHFAHVRMAVGKDASDHPPTAPNELMQGLALLINEAQADPFQQSVGGYRNTDELSRAQARASSNQILINQGIRNMGVRMSGRLAAHIVGLMSAKNIPLAKGEFAVDPSHMEQGQQILKRRDFASITLETFRNKIALIVSKTEIAVQKPLSAFDARSIKRDELMVMNRVGSVFSQGLYDIVNGVRWGNIETDIKAAVINAVNQMAGMLGDTSSSPVRNFPAYKVAIEKYVTEIYEALGMEDAGAAAAEDVSAMNQGKSASITLPWGAFSNSTDSDIKYIADVIDLQSVMRETIASLRGTTHTFGMSADADGNWVMAFTGAQERAREAVEAFRAAAQKTIVKMFERSKATSESSSIPEIETHPTMEQLTEWLGLVEYTSETEGYEPHFRAAGIETAEQYVEGRMERLDWGDYSDEDTDALINWGATNYRGHPLTTAHPTYQEYLADENEGEEGADAWLDRRRETARQEAREPGGVHYQALEREFADEFSMPDIKILVGTLPDSEDPKGIVLVRDSDGDWQVRIENRPYSSDKGTMYGSDDNLVEHTVGVLRRWASENDFELESPPWQEPTQAEENYERVGPKFDRLMTAVVSDGEYDATALLKELNLLQARIGAGIGSESVLSRDDQWKTIIIRYVIAEAVRRGIPKVQYAGGEASVVRGGNWSPDWQNVKSLTWAIEKFDFGGKEREYVVIRNIQMNDPNLRSPDGIVLAPEHLIPVLGKDVSEYMEQQKSGKVPRSSGSITAEPSRADLLINFTPWNRGSSEGIYTITRVGSRQILAQTVSAETAEIKIAELVEAAKRAGGWSNRPVATSTSQADALSMPPMGEAEQWGEISEANIGGPIQMLLGDVARQFGAKPNYYHVLGARNSYDVMNRRLWDKELGKYGGKIVFGKQFIPTDQAVTALATQGFHRATGISPALRARFGDVEVVESRGEAHGYVVMGREGPVVPTVFTTPGEANLALESWAKDMQGPSQNTAVRVWEFEITEQMRETFGRGAITPFHYDPYDDPLIQAAAERIGGKEPSLRDRYTRWRSMWKQSFTQGALDRFYGIRRALTEAGAYNVEAQFNGYIQARLTTSLDSVMRSIMEFGHPTWRDGIMQTEGVGLIEILQPVASQIDLWAMYMAGVRAKRLLTGGDEAVWREVLNPNTSAKRKAEIIKKGRERNWTPEQIERMASLGQTYPVFERVAKDYAAFHKKVLDFAQEAGTINPETRAMWENADYIPFYRVQDDRIIGPMSSTSGIANVSSPIKKLKGGTENVGDLMHNIMINMTKLMDGAMKNHAALTTVDALRPSGIVSNQPMAWSEQLIPMEQVKKALKERGVDPDTIPEEALTGFQKMFAMQAPKGEGIISVMRNGKKEFYKTDDPLLYRAMTAINKQYFGNWMQILRAPKRLLTTWITLDPGFMVANYLRDSLSSFVISRDNVVPLIGGVSGFVRALRQSEEMRTMMSAGAAFENGYINQYDPKSTERLLKRAFKNSKPTDVMLDSPRKLYELWKRIGSATENANRIAVYRAAIAAGKSKAQAAYEAKDLMDFSMSGDWPVIQFLVQTVPFMGARIQGLHRLGRSFRENPVSTLFKGTLVGMAGMALFLVFKDDERYKKLEDWDKDTYFHFWIGESHYRLPKPFEVGAIFNTIPERIFGAINSKETDAGKFLLKRFGFVLSEMFSMSPIPQAAQPMVEMWFNYNFFTRSQIESPYEEQRLPPERYRYNTSPAMIELARALPAGLDTVSGKIRSPLQLQNLYYGYTGTLGKYFLLGADALVREAMDLPEPPAKRVSDYPVVGRFARGTEPQRTRYEEEFYNTLRRAVQAQGSVEFLKGVDEEKRQEYVEGKYEPYIEVSKELENARKQVSRINKEMREIYMDRQMTPEAKRTEIDSLQSEKNEVFEEAYHLRPGGRDNKPALTSDKISFFIEKFNRNEPPSEDLVKAAPVTAELLTDVSALSKRQLQSLARATGASE